MNKFLTSALFARRFNEATDGTTGSTGGTAEVKVVLTRAEKLAAKVVTLETRIAADTKSLAETKQEIETSTRLAAVVAGSVITAKLGRAETTREVEAVVTGVKDDDNGARRYKIEFGTGFDKDVTIIQPAQIVRVFGEEAPAAAPADDAAQY